MLPSLVVKRELAFLFHKELLENGINHEYTLIRDIDVNPTTGLCARFTFTTEFARDIAETIYLEEL